jgi:hypothetical protein
MDALPTTTLGVGAPLDGAPLTTSIDALLSKTEESSRALLHAILGEHTKDYNQWMQEEMLTMIEGGGLDNMVRDEGESSTDCYAQWMPLFLDAMHHRAHDQKRHHQQRDQPSSMKRKPNDLADDDDLEEEVLDDGQGSCGVLDAMLRGGGSQEDAVWREAAKTVVFDNFLDDANPFSDDGIRSESVVMPPQSRPTTDKPPSDAFGEPLCDSGDELMLPDASPSRNTGPGVTPSPPRTADKGSDSKLWNELRVVASGADGVEAFSLDVAFDYDANPSGISRRI